MAKHPYQALVDAIDRLPNIGPRAAARLADTCLTGQRLAGVATDKTLSPRVEQQLQLGQALLDSLGTALQDLDLCPVCHYWREQQVCANCQHWQDNPISGFCVVESIQQADEIRGQFPQFHCFVLHQKLSPTSGVGPTEMMAERVLQWLSGLKFSGGKISDNSVASKTLETQLDSGVDKQNAAGLIEESAVPQEVWLLLDDDIEGQVTCDFLQRGSDRRQANIKLMLCPFHRFIEHQKGIE